MSYLDMSRVDDVLEHETPPLPGAAGDRVARLASRLLLALVDRGALGGAPRWASSGAALRDVVTVAAMAATGERALALEAALLLHAHAVARLLEEHAQRQRAKTATVNAKDAERLNWLEWDDECRAAAVREALDLTLRKTLAVPGVDDRFRERVARALDGALREEDLRTSAVVALGGAGAPDVATAEVASRTDGSSTGGVESGAAELADAQPMHEPDRAPSPTSHVLTWNSAEGRLEASGTVLRVKGLSVDRKTSKANPALRWFAWLVLARTGRKLTPPPCPRSTRRYEVNRALEETLKVEVLGVASDDPRDHSLHGDVTFDAPTRLLARRWIGGAECGAPGGGTQRRASKS
jgi:hypothetical protein